MAVDAASTTSGLQECLAVAASTAIGDDRMAQLPPGDQVAAATEVAKGCVETKGLTCRAQTPAGEWRPGLPKEYACGSGGVLASITPNGVANALREVGIDIPVGVD